MIRSIATLTAEHRDVNSLARAIFVEYKRAWAEFGNGSKVRDALGFEDGEHFEIAAWQEPGARRIADRRLR